VGVAHLALKLGLGHEGGDAVHHDDVNGAAPHQVLGYLQRLLGIVRLGHQQLLDVHATVGRECGIEGVLGVEVCRRPAHPLGRCHGVIGQRGLTRRLRAEYLGDSTAGDSTDAQGHVKRQRACGDRLDGAGCTSLLAEGHDGAPAEVPLDLGNR
jgi:hypothetical protein